MVQREARYRAHLRRAFSPRSRDRPFCRVGVTLGLAGSLFIAASEAEARDYAFGITGGGLYAGSRFVPAVSPQFSISFRTDNGWLLTVAEVFHFLPARSAESFGAYNHIAVGIGRAWPSADLSGGLTLPSYIMPTCHGKLCGRVWGFGIGAYLQANWWLGPAGLSASFNLDWVSGRSLLLPSSLAAMGVAGPMVRW